MGLGLSCPRCKWRERGLAVAPPLTATYPPLQLERLNGAHKELANLQDGGLGGGLSMTGLAHEAQREMADPNMVRNVLYISGTMSVLCLLLYIRSIQGGGGGVGMTPRKNASHIV